MRKALQAESKKGEMQSEIKNLLKECERKEFKSEEMEDDI
jgi:predicted transcriptional regulator